MINSNSFNIKNYLNMYEKYKPKTKKKVFKIFNSMSEYSTFNTKFKPINHISEGYITSTHYKTSSNTKNIENRNKDNNMNIMTSTYIDIKSNQIKKTPFYNSSYTKSTSNFLNDKNKVNIKYSPTQTNESENFKVFKAVKNSWYFPKIVNNKKQNKIAKTRNIYPQNIEALPVTYKDKYISSVFDSTKVLDKYNTRKELELDIDNDLKSFQRTKSKNIINGIERI